MLRLALRNVTFDKTRSLLTTLAISCAIAVILILRGFEQGLYEQSEAVVLNRGGQLIVTQSGVSNFFVVRSSLPQLTRAEIEAIKGVAEAHPITGIWAIYGPEGKKMPLFLMVHDSPGIGGPSHIIKGKPALSGRDIVVDVGFSKKFDLIPGDPLIISDFEFRIRGITEHDSALFSPLAFVTFDGMLDFFLESEIAPDISTFPLLSFLLIELETNADRTTVMQAIESNVEEVDVFTPEQLGKNDRAVGKELFGPVMGVLVSLSFIIGLLVIGLVIFSDISSRQHAFGVMKALGFRLSHIVVNVIAQSFILILLAFPLGVAFAQMVAMGIEFSMPVYRVTILDPTGLGSAFVGVLVITILGSLLPLRVIARADPVMAFTVE